RTNMMTFSNATQATGWKDYSQGAVGRAELVRPEFSGTVLNLKVLEKELLNRPSAVVVLISDGAIDNWATDGKKIMEIFKNHSVAFVQIGGENQTGRDMKAAGFTVLSVNSERDLEGMLIDVSGQLYRNSGESQSLSSDMILPK
ncbi:MAG: hypothetical protein NT051_04440, partial [Candidatus Micrarchaeota archaeon]|nr:hypothetical protein [Candidatus Micrarchaeota archaeon]